MLACSAGEGVGWTLEIPHTWESDSFPGCLQGCWAGREALGVSTGCRLRTELTTGPGQERKEWGSEDAAGRGPKQEHPIKTLMVEAARGKSQKYPNSLLECN